MTETKGHLVQILSEIEGQGESSPKKTAAEIAGILLGEEMNAGTSSAADAGAGSPDATASPGGSLVDIDALDLSLRDANSNWNLQYYWTIYSVRPIIGMLIVFGKKVFRKLAKFLLEPLTVMQNAFNAAAVQALNTLRNHSVVFDARMRELLARMGRQEKSLSALQAEREETRARVDRLEDAVQESLDRSKELEERLDGISHEMGEQLDGLQTSLRGQAAACEEMLNELRRELDAQSAASDTARHELRQEFDAQSASADERIGGVQRKTEELASLLGQQTQAYGQRIDRLQEKLNRTELQNEDALAQMSRILLSHRRVDADVPEDVRSISPRGSVWGESAEADGGDPRGAFDYFKFENRFRGPRSLILDRQSEYLPYFAGQNGRVLDFGCGRGEFLQLLKQENIPAFGVDLYPEYVMEGELLGLDIREGDGIAFLENCKERFGGIFVGQVVEHITFGQLQRLCTAAYERLNSGAFLIMESPNPMCLSIYTNAFYLDPTHQRPVHPLMLQYLLREIGFRNVEIIFTKGSRTGQEIPRIDSDAIRNLDEVNQAFGRLSELVYGSQDYAVVAQKP